MLCILFLTIGLAKGQTIVDYAIQTVTNTTVQPLTPRTTTTTNTTTTNSNVTNNAYTNPIWWNNWNYYYWNTTNVYQQPIIVYPVPTSFVNYNTSNSYIYR